MTAKPTKPGQIKRDIAQLINLYPATLPGEAEYLHTLNHYRAANKNNTAGLQVLGQIGLGDGLELLTCLYQQQDQKRQQQAHSEANVPASRLRNRLLIKIFEPHPINAYELKSLWDQSQSLIAAPHLRPLADAILEAIPCEIIGCQRLLFDDGQLIVDLHFGDVTEQLSQLPHSPAHPLTQWLILPHMYPHLTHTSLWQMARLSADQAHVLGINVPEHTANALQASGFGLHNLTPVSRTSAKRKMEQADFVKHASLIKRADLLKNPERVPQAEVTVRALLPATDDEILLHQRQLLRKKQETAYGFSPLGSLQPTPDAAIAIIGGGLASAHCALALAERGQATALFCQDSTLGQGASGNRQGAIYPLLTPENDELSRFFQQAFLFSRRRIAALHAQTSQGITSIAHDFCGVLQTGHDERSQQRLNKILDSQTWPPDIAAKVNAEKANHIAQLSIDKSGIFYPLGGWVCPVDYAKAAIASAQQYAEVNCHFNTQIVDIEQDATGWYLNGNGQRFGPFKQLVLANGAQLTQFSATAELQLSPFRGQVSHIASKGQLQQLATVLCANGYLTPSHNGSHCLGASYVKSPQHTDFCPQEQRDNRGKIEESYPNQPWLFDIDISDNCARVGVRMVTRDHFPMMGRAPDVAGILEHDAKLRPSKESAHYWQTTPAPVLEGLFILGGLGSRGLSSGPLAAEYLAAMLCGEPLPLDWQTLAKLNPNRMWLRKLRKGKALT